MTAVFRRSCAAAAGAVALLAASAALPVAASASSTAAATGGTGPRSSATAAPARTLHLKSRGTDVARAQRWLRILGYQVHVTGYFGQETRIAVLGFERYHRLRRDGRLSLTDLAVLRAAAARMAGGYATTTSSQASTRNVQQPFPASADRAGLNADGTAIPPTGAPVEIQQMIAAGNRIASKPYHWGGGHGRWEDSGYDCSGSVSYALHGAGLLDQAMTSGELESWGSAGPGRWVTIYANSTHVFMVVAGLRFDTSGATQAGTRWQVARRSTRGYVVRHPTGL